MSRLGEPHSLRQREPRGKVAVRKAMQHGGLRFYLNFQFHSLTQLVQEDDLVILSRLET